MVRGNVWVDNSSGSNRSGNRSSIVWIDNSCGVNRSDNLRGNDSGCVANTNCGSCVGSSSNGVMRSIAIAICTSMVFTDNVFGTSNGDIGSDLMCYWYDNLGLRGNMRSLSGRRGDIGDDVGVMHGVLINMLVVH